MRNDNIGNLHVKRRRFFKVCKLMTQITRNRTQIRTFIITNYWRLIVFILFRDKKIDFKPRCIFASILAWPACHVLAKIFILAMLRRSCCTRTNATIVTADLDTRTFCMASKRKTKRKRLKMVSLKSTANLNFTNPSQLSLSSWNCRLGVPVLLCATRTRHASCSPRNLIFPRIQNRRIGFEDVPPLRQKQALFPIERASPRAL